MNFTDKDITFSIGRNQYRIPFIMLITHPVAQNHFNMNYGDIYSSESLWRKVGLARRHGEKLRLEMIRRYGSNERRLRKDFINPNVSELLSLIKSCKLYEERD